MKLPATLCLFALATLPLPGIGQPRALITDVGACGNLRNHYGPFDYRTAQPSQKEIVEHAHFRPDIENLNGTHTNPYGDDLDYTLRVFPNHVRALLAMDRLTQKEKTDQPRAAHYSIECYYARALAFTPDDHIARQLYANFLYRRGRLDEALKQLDYVVETTRDNPLAQLNVGRTYLDMKAYDKALAQAHWLIAMGYDRPDLKDPLRAAGHWVEPDTSAPAKNASAPVSSPALAASAASSPQ